MSEIDETGFSEEVGIETNESTQSDSETPVETPDSSLGGPINHHSDEAAQNVTPSEFPQQEVEPSQTKTEDQDSDQDEFQTESDPLSKITDESLKKEIEETINSKSSEKVREVEEQYAPYKANDEFFKQNSPDYLGKMTAQEKANHHIKLSVIEGSLHNNTIQGVFDVLNYFSELHTTDQNKPNYTQQMVDLIYHAFAKGQDGNLTNPQVNQSLNTMLANSKKTAQGYLEHDRLDQENSRQAQSNKNLEQRIEFKYHPDTAKAYQWMEKNGGLSQFDVHVDNNMRVNDAKPTKDQESYQEILLKSLKQTLGDIEVNGKKIPKTTIENIGKKKSSTKSKKVQQPKPKKQVTNNINSTQSDEEFMKEVLESYTG